VVIVVKFARSLAWASDRAGPAGSSPAQPSPKNRKLKKKKEKSKKNKKCVCINKNNKIYWFIN
jgi:hypothetical protein